ncbi:hypothetical protein [Ruminococcus albus]|uniref:Uncharacterized protein n=1 Tax=Ruminococcus albus (strain ATCC 27210 / DSM 20455 / JCM 14654 / NCDO 2250 / 7) TaxID=697329 RepID=E6UDH6_RUMA7|nr:hypothetical protein [Ruminococcus albus]ADU22859.1 hypothetical protein Rumal_2379 [Ruminococcus albus 7 = DSM 20455]
MSMTLQWILAGLMFFVPGALMVALNYYVTVMAIKNSKLPVEKRKRYPSGAPFLGGIFCALGVLIAFRFAHPWISLIFIVLDPGGLAWLIYANIIYRKMK